MHGRLPGRANVHRHYLRARVRGRWYELSKPVGLLLGGVREQRQVERLRHLRERVRRLGRNMHGGDRRMLLPAHLPAAPLANGASWHMSVVKGSLARVRSDASLEQGVIVMSPRNVGDVIAGKYRLVRLLGRGSMGEVWLAHHQSLHENVAIKLLTHALTAGTAEDASRAATRLQFEAQVAARLSRRTRHIVQVTDLGDIDGLAYLVMEPLEGMTLEAKLMLCEWLPMSTVQVIVRQVARALEHAHAERVLHRDLKPSNLFLTKDEDGELLVKVLDFGIARTIHRESSINPLSTGPGVVCGTPGYMSPEQARGLSWLDARCDLWALATIAYEALTNELPVKGYSPDELYQSAWMGATIPIRQRRSDLPRSVEAFFERAFAQDIIHRFVTAQELARGFDDACEEATQSASSALLASQTLPSRSYPPVSTRPEGRGAQGPHRRRRLLTAAAFVPLVVVLVTQVGLRSREHLVPTQEAIATGPAPAPKLPEQSELPTPAAPTTTAAMARAEDLARSSTRGERHPVAVPIERRSPDSPGAPIRDDRRGPTLTVHPAPSAAPARVVRDRSEVL